MRISAVYSCVLSGALIAAVSVQYGWHPPFAATWDALSAEVFLFVLYFLSLGSCWGLTAGIRIRKLPSRFHLFPARAASSAVSFAFLGIIQLSPAQSPAEATLTMCKWLAMGFVLGGVIGAVSTDEKPEDADTRNRRIGLVMSALTAACSVFLLAPRERVEPKTTIELSYEVAGQRLEVGSQSLLGEKFGVFGITSGEESNSLVLEPSEWRALTQLLKRAEEKQSDHWQVIGSISDRPPDQSRLEVSRGTGIRLIITSARRAPLSVELPPTEFDSLNGATARVIRAITD